MDMSHERMLLDLLRDVWDFGVGRIEKHRLLRWFEQEKLSVGIWRDLLQRFRVMVEDDGGSVDDWRLFAVESAPYVSFTCLDLADIQKGEGWWEPVDARAVGSSKSKKKEAAGDESA